MIDFLGIGAQKSATSWLFQCLREHPDICLAEEKELHYFSNDSTYAHGSDWYEAHWSVCRSGKRKGEISTSYLSSPTAAERIKAYAPQVKLIALLRHPVDRAESHIRHLLSKRELPEGLPLSKMLELHPDIFENGRYATHLARYRALFPAEQLYIDTYDQVLKDPLAVITHVDTFLGISTHTPLALSKRYNSSAFRASPLHDAANKTHAFLKRAPGGALAIKAIKSLGFSSTQLADAGHKTGEKEQNLFHFTPEERMQLEASYGDELTVLREQGVLFR